MTIEEWLGTDNAIGKDILKKKYIYNNETLDEWLDRVSGGNEDVKQLIKEKKFLFGGRILANRGLEKTGRKITLSNCYVITPPEDSIESIFECATKLARTYSYGGGCGTDLSQLSPRGAKINNAAKATSGSVSFMDLYDVVTGLIGQEGRRGALMLSLHCSHPDLEEFLNVKSDLNKVTKANLSIRVTDEFLEAVKNDADYTLRFVRKETGEVITKTIRAKEFFHKFAEMNWRTAEPAFLFWDRIEQWNLLSNTTEFKYSGVNPCFTGDMKLLTSEGYKTFEELNNTKFNIVNINGDISSGKVWCSGEKDTIKLVFSDKKIIACTPDHRFMTVDGEECFAKDAKGKKLMAQNEEYAYVIDIQENGKQLVYDFSEPKTHWGIVNGVIAHNCAEEPLCAGGSCLLGSINLSEFVDSPFTPQASFNFKEFEDAVRVATIALNEVLDEGLSLHPLQEQRDSVRDWRQIGLGIMGLADMLIKMGITYGSNESLDLCDKIGSSMINTSVYASAQLAEIYGAFPKCNIDEIMSTDFYVENINKIDNDYVKKHGLRNSQLLTTAPTGTLSTMLGISGGIEPIFANYYERKTESLHNKEVSYKIYTPVVKQYMQAHGIEDDKDLPNFFVTAQTLNYVKRIDMQATWQKYIDASISSTVNLPNEFTVDQVKDLYLYAWQKGLKGITIYRAGCEREGILTTSKQAKEEHIYDKLLPISRKQMGTTYGSTYCKKCACGTLYITINRDKNGNVVESFVHTSKGGICQANIGAVNRMASLAMRSGVQINEIIDQLRGIQCPACIKAKGVDGLSCPDILSRTLKEFYESDIEANDIKCEVVENSKNTCPDCGNALVHEGGCVSCLHCGFSLCT